MLVREKIIPALDIQNIKELDYLISQLKGEAITVKVGMELYYSYGNTILEKLKDHKFKIFLDLKMHDIPNTVYRATKALAKNGVDIINVHACGGSDMMKAALDGFKSENSSGLLIGVTQLTSTTKKVMNDELLVPGDIEDIVLKHAQLVKESKLDGIVCSAHEVKKIKAYFGESFKCITPGIRPQGSQQNDQKRIMTPKMAIDSGSDYLVIGRPITLADSPKEMFRSILKEISHEPHS